MDVDADKARKYQANYHNDNHNHAYNNHEGSNHEGSNQEGNNRNDNDHNDHSVSHNSVSNNGVSHDDYSKTAYGSHASQTTRGGDASAVYAEDYLPGGLDDLPPEEAQIVKPSKRKRRWKGVILDDDEYVLRVLYTSFLSQLLVWMSSIALLVGVSQLILPWRFGAILGLSVSSGMLVHWWYTRRFAWAATNRRVISRLGFLNKTGSSVSYTRVTDVDVHRPFMCWFFGNGKVLVNTAAGSGDDLTIYGQADPETIEALIRQYSDWAQSGGDDSDDKGIDNATDNAMDVDVNATGYDADQEAELPKDEAGNGRKRDSHSRQLTGQRRIRSTHASQVTSPEDAARWFMEHVWTPNDAESTVQLRRVHYRYLVQDAPMRPDGQAYRNTLRDWYFLQRAAHEAVRLGWLGALLEPDMQPRVHPFGRGKPGRLSVWAASNDVDDVLLPLCHRHEVTFVRHVTALSWPSLLRFAGKFYDSGTAIIYLSDFDASLERVPVTYLEKQLAKAGTNVRIAPLALTREHIKQYNLPPAPSLEVIHPSHANQHHVELASLEGMRPGELARTVERAIEGYYKQLTSAAVK
jgi:membrane protein YdbS with pleckstrin-like domain